MILSLRASELTSDFIDSTYPSLTSRHSPDSTSSSLSSATSLNSSAYSATLDVASAATTPPCISRNELDQNMTDYRLHSVSALCTQPQPGLPSTMQSSGGVLPASPGMMPRGDGYHLQYHQPTRSVFPNSNGLAMNNLSRYSNYQTTRPMDMNSNAQGGTMFGASGGFVFDSPASRQSSSASPEAPPFHETTVLHNLLINNHPVRPDINAKIHKGFFQVDGKWTCYRRNYFSLSCSFTLRPWIQMQSSTPYIQLSNGTTPRVKSFAMAISAVVHGQENEVRELVQHTPKRDKQSERRPGKVSLEPQPPPSLMLNAGPVSNGHHHMAFSMPPQSPMHFDCGSAFGSGHSQAVQTAPTSHTFERIQFQKATANNGKRRAQQQFYQLVTELYADVSDPNSKSSPQWILVARRLSYPMVVRGRSPGHYKDGRRESTTSIGPESDTGASGDGRMSGLTNGMVQSTRQPPPLLSTYDQSHGRRMTATDQPPLTAGSLVSSSSSSPGFDFGMMNDSMNPMETMKDTNVDAYGHQSYNSASAVQRKVCIEPSGMRSHMPTFNDSITTTKSQDPQDGGYVEPFEPMVSLMHHDNADNHYFNRQDDHGLRNGMKMHNSYTSRPTAHYARY
ncbi:hypothetical protein H105_05442 [Trichophyton soudanense CBS 452.61]|uniref:NDT80 domain-containing protein n=1 Tax=Trichophyton soudanense CBS 452.61 TaxID=1215331 RepID=A0A022XP72_TRISD|nr:hypothetical protein H105_05442 [Trichophyton soudanense CBS 452.61]EZG05021.1 hypothetical protein H106_05263 [Trichophyton rubrum CBS 735.88]